MGSAAAPAAHRPRQDSAARLAAALLLCAAAPAAAQTQTHPDAWQATKAKDHDTDRTVAFTIAIVACAFVACICAAIACPKRFGRGRAGDDSNKKRKNKKAVTSEEILERFPPAKTPRASDGSGQPNCVVCLCEVDEDQDSITTQCGHVFHKDCVLQWWTHKPRRSIRCPTCRTKQKIRNRQHRDGDSSSGATQVSPTVEESSDGEALENGSQAPEQQTRHQRANSQNSWLPDLEAGERQPVQLPAIFAPSPYSAAPTDFTHMSVADEATPASQVSSLPLPGAHQATRDEDVQSV